MNTVRVLTRLPTVLPPRPNLPPEPWPSPWGAYGPLLTTALAALVLGTIVWRVYGRAPSVRRPPSAGPAVASTGAVVMAHAADRVRAALSCRFGGDWSSRTTDEIASDPALASVLGPDLAADLARFLRAADRAKFSPSSADPASIAAWADWASAFAGGKGKDRADAEIAWRR